LRLVRRNDGAWRLIHAAELEPSDVPLPATLRPCTASTGPDGNYSFALTSEPTNCRIYDREDAAQNEAAMRQALPALYKSFRPGERGEI
jgi:pyrimidine-specific ribonucleoside hydrolase